jgi:hypothetical protein
VITLDCTSIDAVSVTRVPASRPASRPANHPSPNNATSGGPGSSGSSSGSSGSSGSGSSSGSTGSGSDSDGDDSGGTAGGADPTYSTLVSLPLCLTGDDPGYLVGVHEALVPKFVTWPQMVTEARKVVPGLDHFDVVKVKTLAHFDVVTVSKMTGS